MNRPTTRTEQMPDSASKGVSSRLMLAEAARFVEPGEIFVDGLNLRLLREICEPRAFAAITLRRMISCAVDYVECASRPESINCCARRIRMIRRASELRESCRLPYVTERLSTLAMRAESCDSPSCAVLLVRASIIFWFCRLIREFHHNGDMLNRQHPACHFADRTSSQPLRWLSPLLRYTHI